MALPCPYEDDRVSLNVQCIAIGLYPFLRDTFDHAQHPSPELLNQPQLNTNSINNTEFRSSFYLRSRCGASANFVVEIEIDFSSDERNGSETDPSDDNH